MRKELQQLAKRYIETIKKDNSRHIEDNLIGVFMLYIEYLIRDKKVNFKNLIEELKDMKRLCSDIPELKQKTSINDLLKNNNEMNKFKILLDIDIEEKLLKESLEILRKLNDNEEDLLEFFKIITDTINIRKDLGEHITPKSIANITADILINEKEHKKIHNKVKNNEEIVIGDIASGRGDLLIPLYKKIKSVNSKAKIKVVASDINYLNTKMTAVNIAILKLEELKQKQKNFEKTLTKAISKYLLLFLVA